VVESTALEMRHTGNRIGGSNPSLSAKSWSKVIRYRCEVLIDKSNFADVSLLDGPLSSTSIRVRIVGKSGVETWHGQLENSLH
jgi:hypothetical protein